VVALLAAAPQHRDRARGVPAQVDDLDPLLAELDHVAVLERLVDLRAVISFASAAPAAVRAPVAAIISARAPDVVVVGVGGDDDVEPVVLGARGDHAPQGVRLRGGVDQQLRPRRPTGQQVGVVVHRADGQLADLQGARGRARRARRRARHVRCTRDQP
jgi:hypothetical protein